jgi:nuclear-control-of-ATPase protein 2
MRRLSLRTTALALLWLAMLLSEMTVARRFPGNTNQQSSTEQQQQQSQNGAVSSSENSDPNSDSIPRSVSELDLLPLLKTRIRFPPFVVRLYRSLLNLVVYKPPVGIVTVALLWRLLSGRIHSLYGNGADTALQQMSPRRRWEYRGRAYCLDPHDKDYNLHGGIQKVRQRLLVAALAKSAHQQPLLTALQVTYRPGCERMQFVREIMGPLALMEASSTETTTNTESTMTLKQQEKLRLVGSQTAQLRATDALLRVCRDRLLKASVRLTRSEEYWDRRVKGYHGLVKPLQVFLQGSVEGDRQRLLYAQAAYQMECTRLGQVVSVIQEKPRDLDDSVLLTALKRSEGLQQKEKEIAKVARQQNEAYSGPYRRDSLRDKISRYSMLWVADGKGFLSVRKLPKNAVLNSDIAVDTLMKTDEDAWLAQAKEWTFKARRALCNVVRDSFETSASSSDNEEQQKKTLDDLERNWCSTSAPTQSLDEAKANWETMVGYVDKLGSLRAVGEGQELRLGDTFIADWSRRIDVLGIPSSLLCLWLATYVHHKVKPHWPYIKREAVDMLKLARDIFDARVWGPLQGIYNDIMNRSEGIMSAFGIEREATSLDHMLRDLGFSDGTSKTRSEGLIKAAEQYEKDMDSGVLGNLIRGRLARLLLVQVQQLKVGMLSALDNIDSLIEGNKIHFQLLAGIPAVIFFFLGTKYFGRIIYNVRAKDLRPITTVHGDMAGYLLKMERTLMFTDNESDRNKSPTLTYREVGDMSVNMHRYLISMDFFSPVPYRSKQCDPIHELLTQLGSLKPSKQAEVLRRVQQMHSELQNYL